MEKNLTSDTLQYYGGVIRKMFYDTLLIKTSFCPSILPLFCTYKHLNIFYLILLMNWNQLEPLLSPTPSTLVHTRMCVCVCVCVCVCTFHFADNSYIYLVLNAGVKRQQFLPCGGDVNIYTKREYKLKCTNLLCVIGLQCPVDHPHTRPQTFSPNSLQLILQAHSVKNCLVTLMCVVLLN